MTILKHLMPTVYPWPSTWGYTPVWGGWNSTPWNSTPSYGEHIQFEGRHEYQEPQFEDDWSDTDTCEDDCTSYWEDDCYDVTNINNNSSRMKRKKRRGSAGASALKLISSSDSLLNAEVIDIDPEPIAKAEGVKPTGAKSLKVTRFSEDVESMIGRTRQSKRNLPAVAYNENAYSDDDDKEHSINETSSYSVYSYLKSKLKHEGRQIDAIKGDGNCFFRAISKVLYGNQKLYDTVRQSIIAVIEQHPDKFEAFTDGPIQKHIKNMRQDKTWATQTEIYAAATLYGRTVYILSPDQSGDKYRWLMFSPQFKYKPHDLDSSKMCKFECYITLCHTHGNHYDRVAPQTGPCNCHLVSPEMSGVKGSVDLTEEDEEFIEIV